MFTGIEKVICVQWSVGELAAIDEYHGRLCQGRRKSTPDSISSLSRVSIRSGFTIVTRRVRIVCKVTLILTILVLITSRNFFFLHLPQTHKYVQSFHFPGHLDNSRHRAEPHHLPPKNTMASKLPATIPPATRQALDDIAAQFNVPDARLQDISEHFINLFALGLKMPGHPMAMM